MKIFLLILFVTMSLTCWAQDGTSVDENTTPGNSQQSSGGGEVVNLKDTIVGNQEQPTVLYIVPWKPADDTTILYLPLSSKAREEIFSHVERVEHQRKVQFVEELGTSN